MAASTKAAAAQAIDCLKHLGITHLSGPEIYHKQGRWAFYSVPATRLLYRCVAVNTLQRATTLRLREVPQCEELFWPVCVFCSCHRFPGARQSPNFPPL